jgi:AraC-like DNA-binding protein
MRFDLELTEKLIIGGIVYSSLSAYILFFFNKKDVRASRLLALGLVGITWYCLIFLMTLCGWIRKFPYIYGYGTPVYYTIPVFLYWYVHQLIDPENTSPRRNYWHFLPAFISFIALLPFYLSSLSVKQQLVDEVTIDIRKAFTVDYGWIPLHWHFILRPLQAAFYLTFQWMFIHRMVKRNKVTKTIAAKLKNWVIIFTVLETLIYVCLAFTTIIGMRHVHLGWKALAVAQWPYLTGIIFYVLTGLFLFINPEVLYGKRMTARRHRRKPFASSAIGAPGYPEPVLAYSPAATPIAPIPVVPPYVVPPYGEPSTGPKPDPEFEPGPQPETESDPTPNLNADVVNVADEKELARHASLLQEYISTSQIYRRPKLSLHMLASEMGMSPRLVSSVLNKYHKQRFTEYINTFRVKYVISRIENNEWQELTFEGLAKEAGFSSKSTFFTAFKKQTSLSPGEYVLTKGCSENSSR